MSDSSSAETCKNIKALEDLKIESLCLTCSSRDKENCVESYASDLIAEMETQGVREHITGVCLQYKKVRTVDRAGEQVNPHHPNEGNLSPRLHEAKVQDRCVTCPPFVKSNCERRQRLDKLTDVSQKAGKWVEFKVICCKRELVSIRLPSQDLSAPKRSL